LLLEVSGEIRRNFRIAILRERRQGQQSQHRYEQTYLDTHFSMPPLFF
jgi:hypothetical protein